MVIIIGKEPVIMTADAREHMLKVSVNFSFAELWAEQNFGVAEQGVFERRSSNQKRTFN